MIEKKPISPEDNVIIKLKAKKEEPKHEIDEEVEPIDSIMRKIDKFDKKPAEKEVTKSPDKIEDKEDIVDLEKLGKVEPIRTIEEGPANDVPTIWELMEEKEKIDEELKAQVSAENEKMSFTIAVSSENESDSGKTKEKKLRFW